MLLLLDFTNNASLLPRVGPSSRKADTITGIQIHFLTCFIAIEAQLEDVTGKSDDSDASPMEGTKVMDDADSSGTNLKDAIKSFRDNAEVVNAGFVNLKEYIERNGCRFTERPLGE